MAVSPPADSFAGSRPKNGMDRKTSPKGERDSGKMASTGMFRIVPDKRGGDGKPETEVDSKQGAERNPSWLSVFQPENGCSKKATGRPDTVFWGERTGVTWGCEKLPQLETKFKAGNDGAGEALRPKSLDAVGVEGFVAADHGKSFDQGLGDDQSIEGISVMKGQNDHFRGMGNHEVQEVEIIFPKLLLPKLFEGHRQGVFAQADFDGDFPKACWTDENL